MKNDLLVAFVLGAVAGGVGAVAAAQFLRTDDVRTRLDGMQTQMAELVGETRSVLDVTRANVQGAWTTVADRAGALTGRSDGEWTEAAQDEDEDEAGAPDAAVISHAPPAPAAGA